MTDPLSARYDAIPFRHGAIPESHPARTGAIARLLGVSAAPPDRCRVLEIGCAEGMNLLPLAERFPQSQFTGIDFSAAQIATGEEARIACDIKNAQLVCADIRNFEGEAADYVIAHGVYSWVPGDTRDALMALISRMLAPGGVAYVSYSVYPGAARIAGLRAIVRGELDRLATSEEPAAVTRLLSILRQSFGAMPGQHGASMCALIDEMCSKPIALCLNNELATENEPTTFTEFNEHAGRHGLRFMAEAHYASMPFEHLPAGAREPLGELGLDATRAQQFLDLIGNRALRNSLLVRANVGQRQPDAVVVNECAIGFYMFPADGRIDLAPGVPLKLEGRHGFAMSVENSAQKAFFAALCEAAPARIRFEDACERSLELLRIGGVPAQLDPSLLRTGILKLFSADQLDLMLTGAGEWLRPGAASSSLMRWQAKHDFTVTSRWHEGVALTPDERRWIAGETSVVDGKALLRTGLCS